MNYELFIAKRIIAGKEYKSSISSPIIKIAVLAIALGMIIMMITVATGSGLQQKIRDKMSGFKGHIQITNYDGNNSEISVVPISMNQDFYPNFQGVSGIKNIQVFGNISGLIRTETDFEGIIYKGVGKDYDWSFFEAYLLKGRVPDFNQNRTRDVLISKTIADQLNFQLADTVSTWFISTNSKTPRKRSFIVTGIYETGFIEFDNNIVIGDIREVRRLNGWKDNEVGGFEVVLDDFDTLGEKADLVYQRIDPTLNATSIVSSYPAIFEWIALFDNNITVIIAIMILVAGINMITALLVLILERVQMVGVLKALGSTNWSVRKVFLYNATYLIFKGLFWGNLIGISILLIQYYFGVITLDPETYYVREVPINLNLLTLLLLNIGTLILCFLMLVIPSMVITKIRPAKSIRFA